MQGSTPGGCLKSRISLLATLLQYGTFARAGGLYVPFICSRMRNLTFWMQFCRVSKVISSSSKNDADMACEWGVCRKAVSAGSLVGEDALINRY